MWTPAALGSLPTSSSQIQAGSPGDVGRRGPETARRVGVSGRQTDSRQLITPAERPPPCSSLTCATLDALTSDARGRTTRLPARSFQAREVCKWQAEP